MTRQLLVTLIGDAASEPRHPHAPCSHAAATSPSEEKTIETRLHRATRFCTAQVRLRLLPVGGGGGGGGEVQTKRSGVQEEEKEPAGLVASPPPQ